VRVPYERCARTTGRVMDLRQRAALELALLAVAAALFLVLVPVRPVLIDLGLATLGLAFIALGRQETRRSVWCDAPLGSVRRRADRVLAAATLAVLLLMAAAGFFLGRETDARFAAAFLATVALFAPWAWLQQAMFQFYLLGRLRLLLRDVGDVAIAGVNGVLFAAVHAPQWDLVIVTGPAGWLWSYYYLRARRLVPIALSHAALGTAYFYSLRGEDLLRRWLAFLW
jgi:membrane protease YdiL (CAAX protease family)